MLIIRKEQMEVFQSAGAPHFPVRMTIYVQEVFPDQSERLTEEGVRRAVQSAIERAKHRGLTNQDGARLYIDLLFRLGWGFDTDPQIEWAGRILSDPQLTDAEVKLQKFQEEANNFLDQVLGPSNKNAVEAAKQLAGETIDGFPAGAWFEGAIRERLNRFWPQKYESLTEPGVEALMRRGVSAANAFGITATSGLFTWIALMFILGSSFDRDPLLGWPAKLLNELAGADSSTKARKLHSEAAKHLRQMHTVISPA
ncbi:MAG: hypothetical protein JJE04_07765 [Acidobacteriia bacterium]|nr:hypothetical protein [Terriglobia bacterium]